MTMEIEMNDEKKTKKSFTGISNLDYNHQRG